MKTSRNEEEFVRVTDLNELAEDIYNVSWYERDGAIDDSDELSQKLYDRYGYCPLKSVIDILLQRTD